MTGTGPAQPVVIAGAGIGGLTAALCLARAGFPVTLLEKRTAWSELGAGLQLSPNASRILIDLGLERALARHIVAPSTLSVSRWGAESPLHVGKLSLAGSRFGAPFWVIGRRALQSVLVDAVRGTGNITVKVGRDVIAAEQDSTGVSLQILTDGGRTETVQAAALVGADGLWSKLRQAIGDRVPPAPTGYTAWRALTPAPVDGSAVRLWMGPDRHAVHYAIDGGSRGNLVVITRDATSHEGWDTLLAPPANLSLRASASLRQLIAGAEGWGAWTLFDREPARMAAGRIALLGDAAHPVLPFVAQGAALAIEDAATLARLIAGSTPQTLPQALLAYDKLRRPRAGKVREAAQRNGRTYHLPGPLAWARDQVIRRLPADGLLARYDWIYGWRDGG